MTETSALAALILAQVTALRGVVSVSITLTAVLLARRSSMIGSLIAVTVIVVI